MPGWIKKEGTRVGIYDELLGKVKIPRFVKVHQEMMQSRIEAPYETAKRAVEECPGFQEIHSGDSVCIACGSREIANLKEIVRAIVDRVKEAGGEPFLIPAMGSHGGATADGQKEILLTYGLTPQQVGAEIRSSMETVKIGRTESGLDVRIDKNAAGADVIILAARIKPHTDFRGPIESGIMKMIAIGMGKQYGASICHSMGFPKMSENVRSIARVVLEKRPRVIGVGIIENAFHETYKITALNGKQIDEEEPALLKEAKSLMPHLPFPKCDVLFVDEIGKNISGPGMDPNITGRSVFMGRWEPDFDGVAVFDLTEESHRNGNGIGNADVTTQRFFDKFDMETTYANSITCMDAPGVKLPAVMPNDRLAMKFALNLGYKADPMTGPKVVWLHNTLCMHSYWISEGLVPLAEKAENVTILTEPREVRFDEAGDVIPFDWN